MEEKWICECGQENDDLFCIRCGKRRPEKAEAAPEVAAEPVAAAPAQAAAATQPKKKSPILGIIIGAVVLVAIILAILFLFVFKGDKTYKNEFGNYSVTVPSGYKTTDYDNGILAQSKDAVFFVDYLETDYNGALIYGWLDFEYFDDRPVSQLQSDLGIENCDFRILDSATYGENDTHSYSLKADGADGQPVTGEVHMIDSRKFGIYLIGYYRSADLSEKKAQQVSDDFKQFFDSLDSDFIPNIPYYELADLRDIYLGQIAIRSELVSDIDVGGGMCLIKDPTGKEEIMMEIILRAKSVAEVFSWEGITDGQIETASTEKISIGRNEFDTYIADYRDKKNNQRAYAIYGIFADNSTPGILAIEYDVSADKKEWAEAVVADILWSWNLDYGIYYNQK